MPPKKKAKNKSFENMMIEKLNIDKDYIPFFKNQNEKKYAEDKIIDITGTTYQADLVSMPIDESAGSDRYILTLINITDNHLYTHPLQKKDAKNTLEGFKFIIARNPSINIKVLQTDHGKEFKNKMFDDFCKEKNIMHIYYNLYNKNSMGIIESHNGMLTKMIYQYLAIMTIKNKKYSKKNVDSYDTLWVALLKKATNALNEYSAEKYGVHGKFTLKDIRDKIISIDKGTLPIGTKVYLRIQKPTSIIDGKRFYGNFRHGDMGFNALEEHIVTSRLIQSGRSIRYYLDNNDSVSYKRSDLLKKPIK